MEAIIEKAKTPVTQIVAGAGGAIISKAASGYIKGGGAVKLAIAGGLAILATQVGHKTELEKAIQAAAVGAGITQFTEGVSELAAPHIEKWASNGEPSKIKDLVKKGFGLAMPEMAYYDANMYDNAYDYEEIHPQGSIGALGMAQEHQGGVAGL